MHPARAAPAVRIQANGQLIAAGGRIGRIADQGIRAHDALGQVHVNVGARGESGQGQTLGMGEREVAHALRNRHDGLDPHGMALRIGRGRPLLDLFITHARSLGGARAPYKLEFSFI